MSFIRGCLLWRWDRNDRGQWALNATRWLFLTNSSYVGQKTYYIRLKKWPGWHKSFGPVRK